MKKILSLTLLLLMSLAVFTFLPARAEDDTETDASVELTAVPVTTSINNLDSLEKIPSPDQLKYFKVMKRENGALYGVRLQANNASSTKVMLSNDGFELEKIPSPDQLKYFKVMKRENGTLYGIRLHANSTEASEETSDTNVLGNALGNLEKILAPQFISLYEKIQKIGPSLWGVKKSSENKNESSDDVKKSRLVTSDMIECVSAAINAKDEAMITLTKDSAEKVSLNINARGACQNDAIASTENQAENLKECVVIFQEAHKEMITNAREKQKDLWSNYKLETEACSTNSVIDSEEELMINDGGGSSLDSVLVQ